MQGTLKLLGGSWVRGCPMAEVAVRLLRTQLGTFKADPTFGVDYAGLDKALPNAAATLQSRIETAFAYYVQNNLVTNLVVTAQASGSVIYYDVAFDDPRDPSQLRQGPFRGTF